MSVHAVILPRAAGQQGEPGTVMAAAMEIAAGLGTAADAIVLCARPDIALLDAGVRSNARSVLLAWHPDATAETDSEVLLSWLVRVVECADAGAAAPALFVFPADPEGDELCARLAARLQGTALGRCTRVSLQEGRLIGHRAAFGGRATVALESLRQRSFATVRASRKPPGREGAGAVAQVQALELPAPVAPGLRTSTLEQTAQPQRIERARVVVSGGRGIGSREGFEHLGALAGALGGAVAGSLPAVDAGWVSVGQQVGQSGKFVNPSVYVAVGISGTLQHLAGIGEDVPIAAINSDPEADIFKQACVGIVGDWRQVLPLLIEEARLQSVG